VAARDRTARAKETAFSARIRPAHGETAYIAPQWVRNEAIRIQRYLWAFILTRDAAGVNVKMEARAGFREVVFNP
jgi:hypothetical protein